MKAEVRNIVSIPGDGIGPEVMEATLSAVNAAVAICYAGERSVHWIKANAGLAALGEGDELLPGRTLALLREHGLGLKGPTGTPTGAGHRSVNVALRQELKLFANIRPVRWFPGFPSPLANPEKVNFTIFRENSEDVYAGIEYEAGSPEARELIRTLRLGDRISAESAIGLKPVSEVASRRIVRCALEHALENNVNRVTIVHKGNIMKFTEGAFLRWGMDEARLILGSTFYTMEEFHENKNIIPEGKILVRDRIADAMFQDLILHPGDHQLLVTQNLNGDYLSDAAAALIGGLGIAPGMNFGEGVALFEAVHGTAPDIAGLNKANPTALMLSACFLLKHLGWRESAELLRTAVLGTIKAGDVTGDLASQVAREPLGCKEFTVKVCERLKLEK